MARRCDNLPLPRRRQVVANRATAIALCLILPACAALASQQDAPASYQVVHGWPQLPQGRILGQATGVDIDSRGNVFVFHRAGRTWSEEPALPAIAEPTIEVFEGGSGRHLRSWGSNFFVMPHGLTIDHWDNVWVTDVLLHQVFKFSPSGGVASDGWTRAGPRCRSDALQLANRCGGYAGRFLLRF